MDPSSIIPQLFGQQVFRLNEVESTNKFAASLFQKGEIPEGTAVIARNQTAGRGQKGTHWISEPDKNLLVSFLLQPDFLLAADQFMLSKAISLAVRETIKKFCKNDEPVFIKWPNDILVKDKKIAGILIENAVAENKLKKSVIGIGININQQNFPKDFHAASLSDYTNEILGQENVFEVLCEKLNYYYFILETGNHTLLNEQYLLHLYKMNVNARFNFKGEKINARIVNINSNGRLILVKDDATTIEADLKEIMLIRE